MEDVILLVERDDGVVTATLNRPERRNALNLALFAELTALFESVAAEPDDRVLMLRGAGATFSSGGDLSGGPSPTDPPPSEPSPTEPSSARAVDTMRRYVGRCAVALHEVRKPVVAAVEGVAAGAGANLAFGCDLVYATETARFAELFVRRGLALDFGGSWLLPRLIGLQQAKRLAFFGEPIGAPEACALGLVTEVLPAEGFHEEVARRARHLAELPPLALSMIKSALDRSAELSFAEAVEVEAVTQAACATSADAQEAIRAFLEKRPARFSGR